MHKFLGTAINVSKSEVFHLGTWGMNITIMNISYVNEVKNSGNTVFYSNMLNVIKHIAEEM